MIYNNYKEAFMFGFKKPNYSCTTIGTITKPSAVKINNMNLPLLLRLLYLSDHL